jgi:hypothetical protein
MLAARAACCAAASIRSRASTARVGNHSDEDKHDDQDRGDQGQLGRRGDQPFAFNSMAETLLYYVDDEADDA